MKGAGSTLERCKRLAGCEEPSQSLALCGYQAVHASCTIRGEALRIKLMRIIKQMHTQILEDARAVSRDVAKDVY